MVERAHRGGGRSSR